MSVESKKIINQLSLPFLAFCIDIDGHINITYFVICDCVRAISS